LQRGVSTARQRRFQLLDEDSRDLGRFTTSKHWTSGDRIRRRHGTVTVVAPAEAIPKDLEDLEDLDGRDRLDGILVVRAIVGSRSSR
jgi:hypothetical protein